MLVFGIACFGYIFGVRHEVQQLVAEAARASVAGLSDGERDGLARSFVSTNGQSYALLDQRRLSVGTLVTGAPAPAFEVAIAYDLTGTFPYQFVGLLPLPNPRFERRAVVQRGGY